MHWYFYPILALAAVMIRLGVRLRSTGTPANLNFAFGVSAELLGIVVATSAMVCSLTRLPDNDPRWLIAGALIWVIIVMSVIWASRMLTDHYPDKPPRFGPPR